MLGVSLLYTQATLLCLYLGLVRYDKSADPLQLQGQPADPSITSCTK